MAQEITLDQVVERLSVLEATVKMMGVKLVPTPPALNFEFVIRVNGQEVWRGLDLVTYYPEIRRQQPEAEVAIGWQSSPVVLI